MIIQEFYGVRADGVELIRTFSDAGLMIERNGALYTEAIDPKNKNREYTETDIKIIIPE